MSKNGFTKVFLFILEKPTLKKSAAPLTYLIKYVIFSSIFEAFMEHTEPVTDIIISLADIAEADQIAYVHKNSCLATYPNEKHGIAAKDIEDGKLDSSQRIDKWRERIENTNDEEKIWVARDNHKVVGFCYVVNRPNRKEVYSLYVLPEYFKQGIGKQLMQMGLDYLGPNYDVILEVVPYNTRAIDFYRKFGFTESGGTSEFTYTPDLPGAKIIPLIEMIRNKVEVAIA